MEPTSTDRFGKRDRREERLRIAGAFVLIVLLVCFEMTLGAFLEQQNRQPIDTMSHESFALQNVLKDYSGKAPLPPKPVGVQRILYLSNSHATTGGKLSVHLQAMLETIAPGRFQVIDLSSPGAFAASLLQRALLAEELQIDLVVIQVAYISFSDRFKLADQDALAEHFFRPGIFGRLPWGFWWRHYDVGLFANHLVQRFWRLSLYINELRNLWEAPLIAWLKPVTGATPSRIVEVDKQRTVSMPAGFDPTFFDWSLYALGRDKHLADLRDLLAILAQSGIPVIGANLPIDFAKRYTNARLNPEDFARYQDELRGIFSSALRYTDYQPCFPVAFTTYDPLHPTWTGARLHAAHLLLLMAESGWWRTAPPAPALSRAILAQEEAVPLAYRQALEKLDQTGGRTYRRYDVADRQIAAHLLGTLDKERWNSPKARAILEQTLLRLSFWSREPALPAEGCPASFQGVWPEILHGEFLKQTERMAFFREALETRSQGGLERLATGSNSRLDWSIRRP